MSQAFASQLGFKIRKINFGTKKIDDTILETYRIVISTFFILDNDNRERFFEESFLLADVKPDVVFRMFFLTMSNIDINFEAWDLQWRSYITENVLLTTKRVELIGKKEFAVAAYNLEHKVFVVHVAAFSIDSNDKVYPSKRA